MKGRLFLVHWNAAEAREYAKQFRAAGWQVALEAKDGVEAYKKVKARPPNVLIVYLTRLPSHGRETAHMLRSVKATRDLPIVFVDGEGEALEKTKAKVPDAIYTTSSKLKSVLDKYARK